jgi:hypothetical protein
MFDFTADKGNSKIQNSKIQRFIRHSSIPNPLKGASQLLSGIPLKGAAVTSGKVPFRGFRGS